MAGAHAGFREGWGAKTLVRALFHFASRLAPNWLQKRCSSPSHGVYWAMFRARSVPHWLHRAKTAQGVEGGFNALQFKASAAIEASVAAVAQW